MVNNDKQFKALEKATKILQIDGKDGLPVEAKWFNHLPTYNKKDLPTDFETNYYPQCINYTLLKAESKELDQFEKIQLQQISVKKFIKCDDIANLYEDDFFITY